jgi:hypothetical protein
MNREPRLYETKLADMVPGVLYYPFDNIFPFVDMYFKSESGRIYGIQVSRESYTRNIKKGSADFAKRLNLNEDNISSFTYVYIPSVTRADGARLLMNSDVPDWWRKMRCEVWKLPADYSNGIHRQQ